MKPNILVKNELRNIVSVHFKMRDIASLETVMNINEQRGFVVGNIKYATLLSMCVLTTIRNPMRVFFIVFS